VSGLTDKAPETIRLIYKAKNLEDSKKVSDYSKYAFRTHHFSLGTGPSYPYGKLGAKLTSKSTANNLERLAAATASSKPN
jgi:hypothetical protein